MPYSKRYTVKYRTLINDCVDLSQRLAASFKEKEPVPPAIRQKLDAANIRILSERMKTLSGEALARAKRTLAALEVQI